MPSTLLTRDLKFKWLSVAQLIMSLANSLISIILAVNGFAYWSIVFANIASITVFTIALNIIKPVKLRFYFDKKLAMEFVQFSFHMYSLGVILLLMFNVDNFLIGALKGASVLGYYVIAFNWGSLACVIVGSVVASVLFPTFAKMQHDRGKLRIFVLETIEYVLLAVLFASGMLFLVSEEFFYYVLGRGSDKWMPALAALQVFCFYCAIRGASDAIGIVILALGDTKVLLKAASAILVVELTLIYPMLSNFGIEGVATVLVVSFIPAAFFYLPYYRKQLNITIGDLWLVIRAPLTAFLVLIVGALLIKSMKLLPLTLLSFGMKTVTGTVCFFLLCGFMTKWRFVRDIRALLKL
jgi:O-antigen/teichoic acid export membrane protein